MSSNILDNLKIILVVFLCVALLMPVVMKIANHVNALDIPNERKVHKEPMPRLGGLAIFMGFLLGYMLFCSQTPQMISILIGSFVLIIVGMIDDINPVRPLFKFSGQLVAAIIVVYYGNVIMQDISAYGLYINFGFLAKPITILFIISIVNCLNLIDGLDGLAGGIATIFFITISFIISIMGIYNGLDASLSLIMIGATLGFLLYNFHPAKIFMGDSGSMFLGYMIAVISLLGFKNVTLTSFLVPVLILAIPILDTLFAIIRRLLRKQAPFKADKEHFHHQLLGMNFSPVVTVLIIYAINIMFSVASIFYLTKDKEVGQIIYIILFILAVWFVFHTSIISEKNPKLLERISNKIKGVRR